MDFCCFLSPTRDDTVISDITQDYKVPGENKTVVHVDSNILFFQNKTRRVKYEKFTEYQLIVELRYNDCYAEYPFYFFETNHNTYRIDVSKEEDFLELHDLLIEHFRPELFPNAAIYYRINLTELIGKVEKRYYELKSTLGNNLNQ